MKPTALLCLAAGGALYMAAASATADDIWVSRARVMVLSDPSPGGETVAEAHRGNKLHVLSHGGPKNAWVQVSFQNDKGTQQGWVFEQSTSTKEVSAGVGGSASASASPLSVGAAGKGDFPPDTVRYADEKHLNLQPLREMRDSTERIKKDLDAFMAKGRVGPAVQ